METQTTPLEKLSGQLKKAQQEVEELVLQFSLGKAEARDKFEELKKELSNSIINWKNKFGVDQKSNQLKRMFEELQLQLTLGKADAIDTFDEQKKKILSAIHELETELKNNQHIQELSDNLKDELERFTLKMEVLRLKYQAKKFDFQSNLKDEMSKTSLNITSLLDNKWKKTKSTFSDFNVEMESAYEHFKKAIQSFGK